MSATSLIPPGPARRRAAGALVAYGLVGLVLLGGLAIATLVAGFMARDGIERIDQTVDEVVAVLDTTTAALQQADTTLVNVGLSLETAAVAIDEAATLAATIGAGAATLADETGTIEFFGRRPLEGVEQPLRDASASLERLAAQLDTISGALATNATDVQAMGARLGDVADSLTAVRDRLASVDTQLGGAGLLAVIVVLAILGWLAVPAVAALWVGRRWRAEEPVPDPGPAERPSGSPG